MEDDDNYLPDESGHLELRYLGLSDLDPTLFSFAHCLLNLDVSFNQFQALPTELSKLTLLQELNCSGNKLEALPESIASLEWLRVIKANGNHISTIPKEIGRCKALEVLNLSENELTSIPTEIAGCRSLRTLLVQNNELQRLPLSLAILTQLQQLDVSNNSHELATTIPIAIHRDVNSIMWILALQQDKRNCVAWLKQDVKLLQHDSIATERELAKEKERVAALEEKKKVLEDDMDSVKYFLVARAHCREFRRRSCELWQEVKRACAQKMTEVPRRGASNRNCIEPASSSNNI